MQRHIKINTNKQEQLSGTTVKFTPVTDTDTMMKSGVQTNINTRHQCISYMKEYETKSIEELRADDYAANRKGPQSGAAAPGAATGGLFSAAPNQTVSSSGGLFGTTTSQPQQAGGLFGQAQQQNKSMFGTVTSAAPSFGSTFGAATISCCFGQCRIMLAVRRNLHGHYIKCIV